MSISGQKPEYSGAGGGGGCCFLLHIDLFTHSAYMMAQGPSSSIVQSLDAWYIDKRLADRFTGITVNTSYQEQSILQSSILAYWTLSGIDPGTKSTVPFWDRRPGSGPQFVVAERENVIQWKTSFNLFKYGQTIRMEEILNLSMTAKQPPSYDGKVSWFRYEELVDDWVTITSVGGTQERTFAQK